MTYRILNILEIVCMLAVAQFFLSGPVVEPEKADTQYSEPDFFVEADQTTSLGRLLSVFQSPEN